MKLIILALILTSLFELIQGQCFIGCRKVGLACSACSDPNCGKCGPLGCYLCDNNYTLSSGSCSSCTYGATGCNACSTSNCQTCDSSDNCLRCRSGYELSGNACNACGDGKYYFASSCLEGTCYSCPENCKTCSDDIHCTECNAHYIAVPSVDAISGESVNLCVECADNEYASSTTTCTTCPTHCTACDSGTECTACDTNYGIYGSGLCITKTSSQYFDGSTIYDCPTHCLTCDSSSVCLSCEANYGIVGTSGVCVSCPTGTYLSGQSCLDCPTGCYSCTDGSNCNDCQTNYKLDTAVCSACPARTFSTSPYSAATCISCPSHCSSCQDLTLCLTCDSGYGLYNNFCVTCPTGTYLNSGVCTTCPTNCTACTSALSCTNCLSGFAIISGACNECPSGTYLYNLDCLTESAKSTLDVSTSSKEATQAVTQVVSVISSGGSIALSAAIAGKIFSNIKYLDIAYSTELQQALATWSSNFISLGLDLKMPAKLQAHITEQSVPEVFEKYEVPSSFLVNFWQNFIVISIIALLFIVVKIFEFVVIKTGQKRFYMDIIARTARVIVQNFLFTLLYSVSGDVLFYTSLEYRSINLKGISILSFAVGIILLIGLVLLFSYHFYILIKYQSLKKKVLQPGGLERLQKFSRDNEGNQVAFKDFKDDSLFRQSFLFILTFRDATYSLMLTTLFSHPFAQSLYVLICNILMIFLLALKRPFESTLDWIQQIFFEITGICVNVGVFLLALMDRNENEAYDMRIRTGKMIIYINMIFNFTTAALMLLKTVLMIKETYDVYKYKQYDKHFREKYGKKYRNDPNRSPIFHKEPASLMTASPPLDPQEGQHLQQNESFFEGLNGSQHDISYGNESQMNNLLPQQQYPTFREEGSFYENNGHSESQATFFASPNPHHRQSGSHGNRENNMKQNGRTRSSTQIRHKRHLKIQRRPHLERPARGENNQYQNQNQPQSQHYDDDSYLGGEGEYDEMDPANRMNNNSLSNAYLNFIRRRAASTASPPKNIRSTKDIHNLPLELFYDKPTVKVEGSENTNNNNQATNEQGKEETGPRRLTIEGRSNLDVGEYQSKFPPIARKRFEMFAGGKK